MSSSTEQWTILRLLEWTTDYLSENGAESPRLDAEVLLAEARRCSRIELYTAFNELADEKLRTAFRELVRRRAEGTPVAYLVGRREFYSRDFRVTPDVLIPRPETEFVVTTLLDLAGADRNRQFAIADVGTGSGILAISAALELPASRITATDLSPTAIQVAKGNAERHGVAGRIQFVESDVLEAIDGGSTFDFIISNPPYVSEPEFRELSPSVRDYEPRLALVGGATGTELIERLLIQSASRLVPGGYLIVEISPMIETTVYELAAAGDRFTELQTVKDLANHSRVIYAQRR